MGKQWVSNAIKEENGSVFIQLWLENYWGRKKDQIDKFIFYGC